MQVETARGTLAPPGERGVSNSNSSMIRITHTTPRRLLGHLRRLQREGEALLDLPGFLTPRDEWPWDARVWRCLDKIAAPHAFDAATERDREDVAAENPLAFGPPPSEWEADEIIRRRITRRLGTLASVIEKVEACAEL
jgi:hypothetical protein